VSNASLDEAHLLALLDAAFAFACTRTLGELVDADQIMRAVDAAAEPTRAARLLQRFVAPARARLIERAQKSELLLGAWIPAPMQTLIADFLGRPAPIPPRIIDEVVKSERVREAVKQMLEESLKNVIDRAFNAAPGGRGLRGLAGLAGNATRGLFGGIGEQVQKAIEERLRDTMDVGVQLVQKRLAQRLASEETARTLGVRRRQIFLEALKMREADVGKTLAEIAWPMIDGLGPPLVAHNVARAEVREAVKAEIAAALAELSSQTVGELLDELGMRELARDTLRTRGLPLLYAFLSSREWTGWLRAATGG
jgi:hypothetical protein